MIDLSAVPDEGLIFVHTPKAAGRTLNNVLGSQYKRAATIDFNTLDRGVD
jgi:hypothetical protein